MSFELARVKLRGLYSVAAGLLLLLGVPLFEAAVLAPTQYPEAIASVVRSGSFAPLLLWVSRHPELDLTFHIVELVPFLLIVALPTSLRTALWPRANTRGRAAAWIGSAGFALYAASIVIGALALRSASSNVADSPRYLDRIAADYAGQYAFQTLLSHVVGGLLVATFMLVAGARITRIRPLPRWLGIFSIVPAGLLALTALQFLADPTQVESATSPLAFVALALWLIVVGSALARLRRLHTGDMQTSETTTIDSAPPAPPTDVVAG